MFVCYLGNVFAKRDSLIYDQVASGKCNVSRLARVKNCCLPRTKQILKAIWNRQLKNGAFPTCQALKFKEISRDESSPRDDKYLEELSSEELDEF